MMSTNRDKASLQQLGDKLKVLNWKKKIIIRDNMERALRTG